MTIHGAAMSKTFKVGDQYEIKSDKTDHVAFHKGSALTRLAR
jgi:hypothetical protein